MGSPARRTWTLAELDRRTVWRLWFDPQLRRWEVAELESGEAPAGSAAPQAKRGNAGTVAHPQPDYET